MSATSQMASDLAFAAAGAGVEVCVITSRLTYEDARTLLPKQEFTEGVDIHRVWTTRFGRLNLAGRAVDYVSFYVSAFVSMMVLTHRSDVIIAKTDPPLISVAAWIVSRIKRARLVNWLQDLFPEVADALGVATFRPLVATLRWLRNLSLKGATMNVVIGRIMQQQLVDLGIRPELTTVIQNWADGNLIRPVDRGANRLRSAWNLQEKFVVGYSGNMGRAHDFDTIIGAMQFLKDDERIAFLIIGGGAGKQRLEYACREYGIRNCHFFPYQEQKVLCESLSVADVHLASLLPKLEGLIVPSKLYGILAAGRPVVFIGSPNGESAQLVRSCECGYALPCGDSANLADLLRELATDPARASALGRNGRRCFENRLDKHHAMRNWINLLTSLPAQEGSSA